MKSSDNIGWPLWWRSLCVVAFLGLAVWGLVVGTTPLAPANSFIEVGSVRDLIKYVEVETGKVVRVHEVPEMPVIEGLASCEVEFHNDVGKKFSRQVYGIGNLVPGDFVRVVVLNRILHNGVGTYDRFATKLTP